MLGWFGKNEAVEAVNGIGKFIDEQQLTSEEQIKYKMQLLEKMDGFKVVQRTIVSIVMTHWLIWAINCLIAVWIGAFFDNKALFNDLVEYAKLEMVWAPTLGVVSLYLGGGLEMFKRRR